MQDIKLIRIETEQPGLPRHRLVIDGKTAGVVEKFIPLSNTPSFKQYRFKATPGGSLLPSALYLVVGSTRTEVIEEAVEVARAIWDADQRRDDTGNDGRLSYFVPVAEMVNDLKKIKRDLDKSFEERGGGFGKFTENEADLSGQRAYIMSKLYARGFDKRVVHALGFGGLTWQHEKAAA